MKKLSKDEKKARVNHLREIAKAYEEGVDPEQIAKDFPALVARFSIRNCCLILAQKKLRLSALGLRIGLLLAVGCVRGRRAWRFWCRCG